MNSEEKNLLKRAVELSEENNHILRKLQRAARLRHFWGFIKIAVIIVLLVFGYIRVAPYVENFAKNLNETKNALPILNSVGSYLPK